jgi:large conductance mechanosensitive channel
MNLAKPIYMPTIDLAIFLTRALIFIICYSSKGTLMFNEFKKFILKGNVVDLSTGVIIGAAFTGIVSSFTKGIVEPVLGLFGGGPKPELKLPIMNKMVEVVSKDATGADVTTQVQKLIELDLGFLITAAVVFFLIVKPMNALLEMTKRKEAASPAAPPAPNPQEVLLAEIRDLLKKR